MAITQEEILKIKDAMKKAEESESPFPILKDGELAVVGDVNDIGKKKHDYTIKFRFPESWGVKGEKWATTLLRKSNTKTSSSTLKGTSISQGNL